MNTKPLICSMLLVLSFAATSATAQDVGARRGPNLMPAPHVDQNYLNNSNTYDNPAETRSRRGANVMPMPQDQAPAQATPRTQRAPAQADNGERAPSDAGARRSGPNIVGESAGLSEGESEDARRREVIPGCERCVAI